MDWGTIIAIVVSVVGLTYGLLKVFLRTYVKATVEESVKHGFEIARLKMREEFERELQALERRDKFKLAALDERLRASQRAYAIWREMGRTLHSSPEIKAEVMTRFSSFWDADCLYLSNASREGIWKAMGAYSNYEIYTLELRAASESKVEAQIAEAKKQKLDAFDDVKRVGALLEKDVDIDAMANEQFVIDGNVVTADGISTQST